jgi:DNA (cytosine-5)-methyltransferase 1
VASGVARVAAVDLFCGAGGLSYGLQQAGVGIVGGFDIDPRCKYPFEHNIGAGFFEQDVRTVSAEQLQRLWGQDSIRLLAGCAPCQPFSTHRRGADTSKHRAWPLLGEFGRLVEETLPDLVTMENVIGLRRTDVFKRFIEVLAKYGYYFDYDICNGTKYGLAQLRRRLVLVASRFGPISVPAGHKERAVRTVRSVIGDLPPVRHGEVSPADPMHAARTLTDINLRRMKASKPGGTWEDWPEELRAPCHTKASGGTFRSVYARMEWDEPSPTVTTQAFNFGTGRFGHPDQDRSLTLREASMLQGFHRGYQFVRPGDKVEFAPLGRLIGNAVPPPLGEAIGMALMQNVAGAASGEEG